MHDSEIICEDQKGASRAPELVSHLRTVALQVKSLGVSTADEGGRVSTDLPF